MGTEEEQQRSFAAWTRAPRAGEQKIGGTGLGLFIVAELIKAHGGRVWIESAVGAGTTMYFTWGSGRDAAAPLVSPALAKAAAAARGVAAEERVPR